MATDSEQSKDLEVLRQEDLRTLHIHIAHASFEAVKRAVLTARGMSKEEELHDMITKSGCNDQHRKLQKPLTIAYIPPHHGQTVCGGAPNRFSAEDTEFNCVAGLCTY